ncbi:MAG: hypothetical protein QOG10_6037 [Kribbellaceae bacterium]|nr:hypothetical protein [Kribbellaceae bacterium]
MLDSKHRSAPAETVPATINPRIFSLIAVANRRAHEQGRYNVNSVSFATIGSDRPLRGVVVGAGFLGPFWAKELVHSQDTELVGWVDLDADRVRARADELDPANLPTGSSLETLLATLKPDFVVNAAAPGAHYEVTMTSLGHGAAVLGEKPLAATVDQAREMVARADETQRLFMVSQNRRYLPALIAYRETVRRLGTVSSLSCDFFRAWRDWQDLEGHFLGTMEQPLLLDMAVHLFDAARALTGADPVAVYCESYDPPWSWFPGAAAANAVFEMTGGLRFTLNGSWCSDGFETTWTGSWRAVGERGSALWDGETAPVLDPAPGQELTAVVPESTTSQEGRFYGLADALTDFVTALRTGHAPQGECHDNLLSMLMCHAAVESAQTGLRVPITL